MGRGSDQRPSGRSRTSRTDGLPSPQPRTEVAHPASASEDLEAAGAVGRVTQYCSGSQANTWHLLVADDDHLEASGPVLSSALPVFLESRCRGIEPQEEMSRRGWVLNSFTARTSWGVAEES